MDDKPLPNGPKEAFTFDKSKFTSEETIKRLYATKTSLFLHSRQVSELTDQEKKIYETLWLASTFDPRLPGTLWEPKEAAEESLVIARKLDQMSEQEFLESNYAYEWFKKPETETSQSNSLFDVVVEPKTKVPNQDQNKTIIEETLKVCGGIVGKVQKISFGLRFTAYTIKIISTDGKSRIEDLLSDITLATGTPFGVRITALSGRDGLYEIEISNNVVHWEAFTFERMATWYKQSNLNYKLPVFLGVDVEGKEHCESF